MTKKYSGGCHCGAVRFEAELDLTTVLSCNCSICSKTGALYAFAPAEKVEQSCGADELSEYQFGNKTLHHMFCSRCGIYCFGRGAHPKEGTPWCGVNVRCLDEIDPKTIATTPWDGKSK